MALREKKWIRGSEISQGPESTFTKFNRRQLTSTPLSWMGSSPLFKTALTEAQNIWSSSLTSPFLRLKPSSLARALVALRFDFVGRKLDSIQRCPPVLNCLASIRPFIIGLIMGNARETMLTFISSLTCQRPSGSFRRFAEVVNGPGNLEICRQ